MKANQHHIIYAYRVVHLQQIKEKRV
jgi:hypothetical protein